MCVGGRGADMNKHSVSWNLVIMQKSWSCLLPLGLDPGSLNIKICCWFDFPCFKIGNMKKKPTSRCPNLKLWMWIKHPLPGWKVSSAPSPPHSVPTWKLGIWKKKTASSRWPVGQVLSHLKTQGEVPQRSQGFFLILIIADKFQFYFRILRCNICNSPVMANIGNCLPFKRIICCTQRQQRPGSLTSLENYFYWS